jgi:alkylated DNA repair dioxygenase AlkB
MILNVQREALFQITKGEAVTDIQLPVGSLLVLSGESRYEWKHRVLPMAASETSGPGSIERVSLVLGFQ